MFRRNVADKAASVVANIWDTYDILFGSTLSMLLVQCWASVLCAYKTTYEN